MGLPILGLGVRAITNGIGLTQEAIAARKQHKLAKSASNEAGEDGAPVTQASSSTSQPDVPPPSYEASTAGGLLAPDSKNPDAKVGAGGKSPAHSDVDDSDSEDSHSDDEEAWALDDAETAIAEDRPKPKTKLGLDAQETMESMCTKILATCGPPPSTIPQLAQPVILPQRRPGNRQRGFVNAYAPILQSNGIDETTFLAFLDTFHHATHSSPILKVIQIGAGIAGFVPEPTAQITSTVVQIAVGTAQELQRRQRVNSFLDEVNDRLFKPRGLYALIMSYKPEQRRPVTVESVDIDTMVSKREESNSSTIKGALKVGAGTTYGALEMPEAAPLKYPELDRAVAEGDAKLKVAGKFLGDYYDRRAQATYAAGDPNSSLNLPDSHKPQFASKFADPNDPIHNGSIVTLLSGGKINLPNRKRERRQAKRGYKQERKAHRRAARRGEEYVPGNATGVGLGETIITNRKARKQGRRTMKKGLLYLMIVPLPTEAEATAAEAMARDVDEKNGQEMQV